MPTTNESIDQSRPGTALPASIKADEEYVADQRFTKLIIEKFLGKETYNDLGCDFTGWGGSIDRANQLCSVAIEACVVRGREDLVTCSLFG